MFFIKSKDFEKNSSSIGSIIGSLERVGISGEERDFVVGRIKSMVQNKVKLGMEGEPNEIKFSDPQIGITQHGRGWPKGKLQKLKGGKAFQNHGKSGFVGG